MISPWAYVALHATSVHYQDAPRYYPAKTGRLESVPYENGDPRAAVMLPVHPTPQRHSMVFTCLVAFARIQWRQFKASTALYLSAAS